MYIPKPSVISVKSLDDPVHIYFISDFHLKEKGCNEELLKKHIEIIRKDPAALAILGGDHASYIASNDKRLDFDTISSDVSINEFADWAEYLIQSSVNLVEPIRDKIILAFQGNHEYEYTKKNQHDVHKRFCKELGIFNGGYSSVFSIVFKTNFEERQIVIHGAHGRGNSTTRTGVMNNLKRYMNQTINSDLTLIGHMHHQVCFTEKVFYYNNGCQFRYKTAVCPGSYLESYTKNATLYGERAGYDPPILGCAKIIVIPRTKEMQVEWMR